MLSYLATGDVGKPVRASTSWRNSSRPDGGRTSLPLLRHKPTIWLAYWNFRLMMGARHGDDALRPHGPVADPRDNGRWRVQAHRHLDPVGPVFAMSFGWIFTDQAAAVPRQRG